MDSRKLTQNIETDSFDRELFSDLEATSEELKNLIERGQTFCPTLALWFSIFSRVFINTMSFSSLKMR